MCIGHHCACSDEDDDALYMRWHKYQHSAQHFSSGALQCLA